mmetsp:Transcript_472/g.1313  ORF Transcript_472/g.1313 Transcript_472/m.1313 type:complete len:266 (-) Transcript_472:163-960(-)
MSVSSSSAGAGAEEEEEAEAAEAWRASRKARTGSPARTGVGGSWKLATTEAKLAGVESAEASWPRAWRNCGARTMDSSSSRVRCVSGRCGKRRSTTAGSSKMPEARISSALATSESRSGDDVEEETGMPKFCIADCRAPNVRPPPEDAGCWLRPCRNWSVGSDDEASEAAGAAAARAPSRVRDAAGELSPFMALFTFWTFSASAALSLACIQKKKRRDAWWENCSTKTRSSARPVSTLSNFASPGKIMWSQFGSTAIVVRSRHWK